MKEGHRKAQTLEEKLVHLHIWAGFTGAARRNGPITFGSLLGGKTSDRFCWVFFRSVFHAESSEPPWRGREDARTRGRAGVISVVQHGEAIGVNSATERLSPPEELISQECDGQAIIATGALLTSLGQVAGCGEESKHDTAAD